MQETQIQKSQKPKSWYKRWWAIVLFVISGIILLIAPLFIYQTYKVYQEIKTGTFFSMSVLADQAPYDMELLLDDFSPSLGSENAKVQVIEFGDFNCPLCQQSSITFRLLMNQYSDQVKFYWRNYPVVSPSSIDLAVTGICANKQDKFWQYHDYLFNNQSLIDPNNLKGLAAASGLNMVEYEKCMNNKMTSAQILKDNYAAADGEVRGTPTFFINGYKVEGVVPHEVWQKIIDAFLAEYE